MIQKKYVFIYNIYYKKDLYTDRLNAKEKATTIFIIEEAHESFL